MTSMFNKTDWAERAKPILPFRRQPGYRLSLGGVDLAPKMNGRLINLGLSRKRGGEVDTLELTLSDHDGKLALPPRGVLLTLALGWETQGLINRGHFVVDEVEFSGAPDQVTIRARSADMRKSMPSWNSASWHHITLGEIVEVIAKRYGLTPRVENSLAPILINHIDQNEESDLNFLNRLGQLYGGVPMVSAGVLMMIKPGESKSASGRELPVVEIRRRDGDQYRYSAVDRERYTGIKASWQNTVKGRQESVSVGDPTRELTLKTLYASEEEARHTAQARLDKIRQHAAEFEMTLALARPELLIESPIALSGFKQEINGLGWVATDITESLSDQGYTMNVKCVTDGMIDN